MRSKTHLSPLTPKSEQHLISPYNITPESHIKIMRKKKNDHQLKKALDREKNSSCHHLRKCLENSMENMHSDVTVKRVKNNATFPKKVTCYWC